MADSPARAIALPISSTHPSRCVETDRVAGPSRGAERSGAEVGEYRVQGGIGFVRGWSIVSRVLLASRVEIVHILWRGEKLGRGGRGRPGALRLWLEFRMRG
jgi:hypothetical protein